MSETERSPLRLAVLISGAGRTLKNFIDLAAEGSLPVDLRLVVSSSARAGGLEFARAAGIANVVLRRQQFDSDQAYGEAVFAACRAAEADIVAMAGFLKLAPVPNDFAGRVVNIHPALLPSFGGPGMYGARVHQAVLAAGVRVTGVTVHFVNNHYDDGPIIWQQPAPVFDDDTVESLTARVFEVEKEAYPHVLRLLAAGRVTFEEGRVRVARGRPPSTMRDAGE